jgi:hypothetical protein
MVLPITHDGAFEAYMPARFRLSVWEAFEAAEVLGTCCCGDARPALAYQRGPALLALGRHDCAQQLKGRVHPVEQSNTEDAEQPMRIHAA